MKLLLGKKIGMTQVWDEIGNLHGVTAIELGPCYVIQKKNVEKEGYSSVQIAFEEVKEKRLLKPMKGHQKQSFKKTNKYFSHLLEVRDACFSDLEVGDPIACSSFQVGDRVNISGISKGKGFQGAVKRHNFRGGPKTHGSTFHRSTGSVGAGTDPGRVAKGKAMPGHMGARRVTSQGLKVVTVDEKRNVITVCGSVPGSSGSLVSVYIKEGK